MIKRLYNIPSRAIKNTPLAQVVYENDEKRRYTKMLNLIDLAVSHYKRNSAGITFYDLIKHSIARHKKQAQTTLKYALQERVLFTIGDHRPQRYYPCSIKSEIMKNVLSKNIPKQLSEVTMSNNGATVIDSLIAESLVDYVLPLLPALPMHIHKIQLRTKLIPQCYAEMPIEAHRQNRAKEYLDLIGSARVTYLFYPNGTVIISLECSNHPLKLETDNDTSHILTFFGQVRDRLLFVVSDRHERLVPDVLKWELTQCDINKDIQIGDWLQFSGPKIQVSHLDHLFRVYIKSMGEETVCRVEESLNPKKPVIETINEIFNPNEKIYKRLVTITQDLAEIKGIISNFTVQNSLGSTRSVKNDVVRIEGSNVELNNNQEQPV